MGGECPEPMTSRRRCHIHLTLHDLVVLVSHQRVQLSAAVSVSPGCGHLCDLPLHGLSAWPLCTLQAVSNCVGCVLAVNGLFLPASSSRCPT